MSYQNVIKIVFLLSQLTICKGYTEQPFVDYRKTFNDHFMNVLSEENIKAIKQYQLIYRDDLSIVGELVGKLEKRNYTTSSSLDEKKKIIQWKIETYRKIFELYPSTTEEAQRGKDYSDFLEHVTATDPYFQGMPDNAYWKYSFQQYLELLFSVGGYYYQRVSVLNVYKREYFKYQKELRKLTYSNNNIFNLNSFLSTSHTQINECNITPFKVTEKPINWDSRSAAILPDNIKSELYVDFDYVTDNNNYDNTPLIIPQFTMISDLILDPTEVNKLFSNFIPKDTCEVKIAKSGQYQTSFLDVSDTQAVRFDFKPLVISFPFSYQLNACIEALKPHFKIDLTGRSTVFRKTTIVQELLKGKTHLNLLMHIERKYPSYILNIHPKLGNNPKFGINMQSKIIDLPTKKLDKLFDSFLKKSNINKRFGKANIRDISIYGTEKPNTFKMLVSYSGKAKRVNSGCFFYESLKENLKK